MVAQSFLKRVHSLLAPLYGYAKRRRRTVLGIEPLEDRTLLAVSLEIAIEGPSPVSGFATSVATTEQYFIVGSPSSGTANSGQAFVYEVGTGALVHTLNNPAGGAGDQFGYSVAVSGNNILVGAPFYDSGTKSQDQDVGRMYLFDLTTGGLLQTLDNPDPEPDDQFGASVDISGTLIVGGAAHHSTPQNDAGAVHVFDTSGTFLRTINNPEPHPNDHFGTDVSIDGNLIAVGEVFDNTGAEDAGSVYILDATNGNLLYELRNPFPTTNDYFGHAVTISGNLVVAAVEGDEVGAANNAGSVYVFDLGVDDPTTYALHIQNPNPTTGDHFGHSLEIDGNNLVIGANLSNIGGDDTGVAYVYDIGVLNPTPTVPVCTIENPDHNPGDQFGESVAITGMAVIVGANLHDNLTLGTLGDDLGAVYAYRLDPAEALLKLEPRHRHLLETTIMNGTLKVSDIVVSSLVPDGYTLGLAGPDAGIFDIVGTELILKAGTVFDFETKTTYTVDVTLDSPLIPSMPGEPDATDTFTLHLIDVLERPEVQVAVNGTEVYDNGTVNFGEAAVFDAPPTRTFVVRNDGIADLILQPLSIPGGFTLLSPNFTSGQIVAPGAQTSFTLQMNTDTLGLKAGVLTFANNDPDAAESNYDIKLTGGVISVSAGFPIVDNGDVGFFATNDWISVTGYGYESDALVAKSTDGTRRAVWGFGGLAAGSYQVSGTWLNGSDRSTAVPVIIRDGIGGPIVGQVLLDQKLKPVGTTYGNRPFQVLDTVPISSGTLIIEMSNQGTDKLIVADAMRIDNVTLPADTPDISVREGGVSIADGGTHTLPAVSVGSVLQKTFVVRNDGTADIILQPLVVSGAAYSLISPNFSVNQVLAPGAEVTFTIEVDTSSPGTYLGNIAIDSNDPDESPFDILLSASVRDPSAPVVIVDDGDAEVTLVGVWTGVVHYGYDLDAAAIGKNLAGTATWTIGGLTPGDFDVSTTWLNGSDRATNATYVIRDGVGGAILATVPVNQKVAPSGPIIEGGRPFEGLGVVTITGSTLVVELSNAGADGAIIVDAVRVERVTPPVNEPEVAVLDGALTVLDGATVSLGSAAQGGPALAKTFTVRNTGTADLTLQPLVVSGVGYSLASANFTPGQIVTPGNEVTFTVALDSMTLGKFDGSVSFANSDGDENPFDIALTGTISEPLPMGVYVVDDGDAGFSTSAPWSQVAIGYEGDAQVANDRKGTKTAQWVFDVDSAGNYEVSTTWLRGSDRAANVDYVIRDGIGGAILATIGVDQRIDPVGTLFGGRPFQTLSTVSLTGTQLVVEISTAGTTGAVIADAVRISLI